MIKTRKSSRGTEGLVELQEVKFIVLHQTLSFDKPVELLDRDLREFTGKGLGFHKVIRSSGKIEDWIPEGYSGDHCVGYNHRSIGIGLIGYFNLYSPTDDQIKSLVCLLKDLKPTHKEAIVVGHHQLNPVECPGQYFPLLKVKHMIGGDDDAQG